MSLPQEGIPLVIVTYQDIYQWVVKQRDGWGSDAYQKHSAVARISPADLKKLDLTDGARVELRSQSGSVVVEIKSDPACEGGMGYMPASLYSNRLAGYDPSASRLPNLRRIEVRAVPTQKDITPLPDLLVRKTVA